MTVLGPRPATKLTKSEEGHAVRGLFQLHRLMTMDLLILVTDLVERVLLVTMTIAGERKYLHKLLKYSNICRQIEYKSTTPRGRGGLKCVIGKVIIIN